MNIDSHVKVNEQTFAAARDPSATAGTRSLGSDIHEVALYPYIAVLRKSNVIHVSHNFHLRSTYTVQLTHRRVERLIERQRLLARVLLTC